VTIQHWTAPTMGEMNRNVDATFSKDKNCSSAAMCARDEKGDFTCSQTVRKKG